MELKLMMEKLGEPQTHLGLKAMIKEVDEDNDGQISFREVSKKTHRCGIVHMSQLLPFIVCQGLFRVLITHSKWLILIHL